jgi:hypothetical protein
MLLFIIRNIDSKKSTSGRWPADVDCQGCDDTTRMFLEQSAANGVLGSGNSEIENIASKISPIEKQGGKVDKVGCLV